ncbi:MAG: GTPase HflX [Planctomycetota bacterium]|nr:GTPase HflX [Planctomycetota bacterium]MDA0934565.1 GTPase HflX [Planctomycetota bacterium]MDA1222985.1 GTPase HflX [Planctomycetota bacterium]
MNSDRKISTTAASPLEVILCGIVPHGDTRTAPEALAELTELSDTGNFVVAGCVTQHRRHPDPNTYMGSGKLGELAELVEQTGAKAVITDDPLSPAQGRNMEKTLKVSVLDRSELILHIFGHHARTTQARLQVELARLQYQMPRLKRMWTHLERQRGGIGVRGGAGEKQIDLDRSELRARISAVQSQLKKIEERKVREVRSRTDHFTIALVGYTNAGKSTLMNALTEADVLAEDKLFSTLDTRTRHWRLPGGRTVLLSDTVGFIRKLPHQLVASFHATLEEALNADLLFLLVDGSSPDSIHHLHTVEDVLGQLGADHIPRIHVINKVDQVDDMSLLAPIYAHGGTAVQVSAKTRSGFDDLAESLQSYLAHFEQRVTILVPHHAGALHAEIRSTTTVLSEFYTEQGCLLEIQASPSRLGRLLARGAVVAAPKV